MTIAASRYGFEDIATSLAVRTIALLTRAFRSIVLAIKAVLVNLISMAAAFGVMTWF